MLLVEPEKVANVTERICACRICKLHTNANQRHLSVCSFWRNVAMASNCCLLPRHGSEHAIDATPTPAAIVTPALARRRGRSIPRIVLQVQLERRRRRRRTLLI